MAYYSDLRDYLKVLDEKGKLRKVHDLINIDTELHPLVRWQYRGLPESERTGFLFENLTDTNGKSYRCRVASSVIAANREIYALAMQCGQDEIPDRWQQAYSQPYPGRLVATGPVKEEIHKGERLLDHDGVREFALPMAANGWESLPRMTANCWITKDPETGANNIGTYNGYLLGPSRFSVRSWDGHIIQQLKKCKQKGVPLPAAAVIGPVPAVCMVSVTRVPLGSDEMAIAGGIAGGPIDVVKCETVDIEVPASSEIVFEGEISPDYMEPDPASGEHTGYMIINEWTYVFNVKCITHRKNPIWHDMISQLPPSESSVIRGIGVEGTMKNHLVNHCGIPQVKSVAFHHSGGGWRVCVVQMHDVGGIRTRKSTVWQALMATLSIHTGYPKIVVAVDEDIDPRDSESVFWALSYRFQPHRDSKIIQGRTATLDQSSAPYALDTEEMRYPNTLAGPSGASAMLMDATRKWDYTPIALPTRDYMERARDIWNRLGFPPLTPKEPWFGRSLGMWPEEYARQAELGKKGDFDAVAKELKAKGRKI